MMSKRKFKSLFLVLIVGLLILTLQTSSVYAQKTITFQTSVYVEAPHQKAINLLIEEYNKTNPDVNIEVFGAQYSNFFDNLTTEVLTGTQGDIVQLYPENIARYNSLVPGGAFINLNDFIEKNNFDNKLVGQEFCEVDGEYLALSNYAWGTTGLFYRKSIFEEVGINAAEINTLKDFEEAVIKLDKNGYYGFGAVVGSHPFVTSEWSRMVARVVSDGLYFPDGESGPYVADRVNVDSPANIWAAEWWQKMILDKELFRTAPDKKKIREFFWNGNIAMNIDGPWFIGMSRERDEILLDDIGLIPQPSIKYDGKEYKPNPTMYPLVTMISKNSPHKEEALEFLKWMTSFEAQEIIVKSGMIPSNQEYIEKSDFAKNNPLAYKYYDFIDNNYRELVADPSIPQMGELSRIMINATQEMFEGGDEPSKVLTEAAEEIEEVLDR
ncbi:carbohydrate ABC transporter substrate-binding protein (CUT1 family) [Halanaerobium congolense]|uniref:Carbohydrate ABC transporter substrate-binding protein (CUT1 family) n=1 Tax=Halanaerobium congolense TaxID=54121 RepID=A0A4R8GGU0_9FIRM|nr:sugar ABC transporter substrate-binding protein [Halanaerobium congolense]TDX41421.1 carbohydrate ABC transporter substrate-binding protein (CUT1 family) [Halanaerobium congolense]